MFEAIRHNLTGLTRFTGRDSRSTFWFYILFLVIVQVVVSMALSMVAAGIMGVGAFRSMHAGAGDAATQAAIMSSTTGMVRISMWGSALISLAMTFLVAASFTRRLHDSNKPGWITAVVVVLQLISIVLTIGMIGEMVSYIGTMKPGDPEGMKAAMQANQARMAAKGMIGWIPLLIVLVFGVWPSSDGENRYGPEPEHL